MKPSFWKLDNAVQPRNSLTLTWWIWASCCALDLYSFHLDACSQVQPGESLTLWKAVLIFCRLHDLWMAFHGFIDNLSWWIWASCCALDLNSFHLETCSQVQPGESLTLWKAVLIFCRLHDLWMAFHGFIDNLSWWIWASCCDLDLNSFHLETCSQVPGSS